MHMKVQTHSSSEPTSTNALEKFLHHLGSHADIVEFKISLGKEGRKMPESLRLEFSEKISTKETKVFLV